MGIPHHLSHITIEWMKGFGCILGTKDYNQKEKKAIKEVMMCWLIILNHLCAYSSCSCILTFFLLVCSISLVLDRYSSFYWIIFFCLRLSVKSYYNQYHFLSIGKALWVEWSSSNSGSSEDEQCVWEAAWEKGISHVSICTHTCIYKDTHILYREMI